MNKVTLPYYFTPRFYQLPFLEAFDSGILRFVLCWHRRSGKDKTVVSQIPKKMFERVGLYLYFLPTYTQANKVIWKGADKSGFRFLSHIPKEIIKGEPNETEMRVELVNGSIIQFVGADNIDRIVGTNPVGVVFSEFSLMKPNVWDLIRPILAENTGWAIFIFTPRGMNHAWNLLQQAMNNPKWFVQILTVDDTQAISKEAIEEERLTMPQDLFEQEYYCKFIEGAGQFFRGIDRIITTEELKPEGTHKYQMGVDLAKYQDYTVITVIDLTSFKVVEIERFNQIDWALQKARIEAIYLRYFSPLTYIDSTGVGDPIYEDLFKRGLNRIQPFKFTEQSRRELLTNLQLHIEQGKISIPDNQILINELRSMRYELMGDKGKVKAVVPDGMHDDMIMSLALACYQLPQNPIPAIGSIRYLQRQQDNNMQTSYE